MSKIKKFLSRFFLTLLALSVILLIIFSAIQKSHKPFDSQRLAIIDHIGNNYIFRGNNPFITQNGKTSLAYEELISGLNQTLEKNGESALKDYYFIDISLLDLDQYRIIAKERQFFDQHPNYGTFENISIISPYFLMQQLPILNSVFPSFKNHYESWLTDNLEKIHQLAAQQKDKPVIIYIHCDSGRDRTGMIAIAYKLLFKNTNFAEGKKQNIFEAGRNSRSVYLKAVQTYCERIKTTLNKEENYCRP